MDLPDPTSVMGRRKAGKPQSPAFWEVCAEPRRLLALGGVTAPLRQSATRRIAVRRDLGRARQARLGRKSGACAVETCGR